MKEKPILFSSEMVRAILENRKTQTRRVIKPQPCVDYRGGRPWHYPDEGRSGDQVFIECPYGQPGDRIWVREAWGEFDDSEEHKTKRGLLYKADYPSGECPCDRGRWYSPMHMPRQASRISLEILNVRVERLQEISEDDAVAEGFEPGPPATFDEINALPHGSLERSLAVELGVGSRATAKFFFDMEWDRINSKRGFPWSSNPWVWVIEFKRATDQRRGDERG